MDVGIHRDGAQPEEDHHIRGGLPGVVPRAKLKAWSAARLLPLCAIPGCQLEMQSLALSLKPCQDKRERFAFVRFSTSKRSL